jgi:LysM repeat protein
VSSKKITPEKPAEEASKVPFKKSFPWKAVVSWSVTGLLVGILLLVLFQQSIFALADSTGTKIEFTPTPLDIPLPTLVASSASGVVDVSRNPNVDTKIPDGVRQAVVHYTVQAGDSLFSIAKQFNLKPESVLWANYNYFNDVASSTVSIGWDLLIPPTDGILYTWKQGDSLTKIADSYTANISDIISWPSNHMEITNPGTIAAGSLVMIPGGSRPLQSWIQVVAYSPKSGVTRVIAGAGGCQVPDGGPVGSTGFIWPSANNYLSGYDFTSYHKGIDIAANTGDRVWASDSGTVVYAGPNDSGYGNMVMIDHNNGYATLYGHLSSVLVTCGSFVYQGATIGLAGATGNTTGPHLHFEVRLDGGFINPWYVLP